MTSAGEGDGIGNRVQVVVRVRPLLPNELGQQVAVTCRPEDGSVQVRIQNSRNVKPAVPTSKPEPTAEAKMHKFDACMPGSTTQDQFFEDCGIAELVQAAMDGYHVTIFAFGQTGSGKTYTMIGANGGLEATAGAEAGLVPKAVQVALQSMQELRGKAQIRGKASCMEIYNEQVSDLFSPEGTRKPLSVRHDHKRGTFHAEGLRMLPVREAATVLDNISKALGGRATRSHLLNEHSSRSHCLTTLHFERQDHPSPSAEASPPAPARYGSICLVDLAGSERLKQSGNSEIPALQETASINKSLFTLGQVLAGLCLQARGSASAAVPYRNSKLTQLLWQGLKGSGRTLMVACCSPLAKHAEETLNTLHFASMAIRIKCKPVVILDPQDQLVLNLKTTITKLRQENKQLSSALHQLSKGIPVNDVLHAGLLPESVLQDANLVGGKAAVSKSAQQPTATTAPTAAAAPPAAATSATSAALNRNTPTKARKASPERAQRRPQTEGLGSGRLSPRRAQGTRTGRSPARPQSKPLPSRKIPANPGGRGSDAISAPRHRSLTLAGNGGRPRTVAALPSVALPHALARNAGLRSTIDRPLQHSRMVETPYSPMSQQLPLRPRSVDAGLGLPENPDCVQPSSGAEEQLCVDDFDDLRELEAEFQANLTLRERDRNAPRGPRRNGWGPQPADGDRSPPVQTESEQDSEILGWDAPGCSSPPAEAEFERVRGGSGVTATSSRDATAAQAAAGRPPLSPQRLFIETEKRQAALGAKHLARASGRAWIGGDDGARQLIPEEEAVKWAERNDWFGADAEMTAYAYEVHDILVNEEALLPPSAEYYNGIERRVAQKFPDRWRQYVRSKAKAKPSMTKIAGSPTANNPMHSGDPRLLMDAVAVRRLLSNGRSGVSSRRPTAAPSPGGLSPERRRGRPPPPQLLGSWDGTSEAVRPPAAAARVFRSLQELPVVVHPAGQPAAGPREDERAPSPAAAAPAAAGSLAGWGAAVGKPGNTSVGKGLSEAIRSSLELDADDEEFGSQSFLEQRAAILEQLQETQRAVQEDRRKILAQISLALSTARRR